MQRPAACRAGDVVPPRLGGAAERRLRRAAAGRAHAGSRGRPVCSFSDAVARRVRPLIEQLFDEPRRASGCSALHPRARACWRATADADAARQPRLVPHHGRAPTAPHRPRARPHPRSTMPSAVHRRAGRHRGASASGLHRLFRRHTRHDRHRLSDAAEDRRGLRAAVGHATGRSPISPTPSATPRSPTSTASSAR